MWRTESVGCTTKLMQNLGIVSWPRNLDAIWGNITWWNSAGFKKLVIWQLLAPFSSGGATWHEKCIDIGID